VRWEDKVLWVEGLINEGSSEPVKRARGRVGLLSAPEVEATASHTVE
jgi:hypothetical protein